MMRCTLPPTGRAAEAAAFARHAAVPVLRTERLTLRAPEAGDLGLFTALATGPEAKFLGGPRDAEGAYLDFMNYVAGWLIHGHGLWSVEREGRLVGFVVLGLEWTDRAPEIGWMVDPACRGEGIASEAARAVRDFAVDLLGPGETVSYIAEANAASIRVAEKLGAARDAAAEAELGDGDRVYRHGRPA